MRKYYRVETGGDRIEYILGAFEFSAKRAYYEGRTESHEQLFFACELGTADEGECGGR